MITISQKQKELTKLQEQMLALQKELIELENQNPAYKKRCDELNNERSQILSVLATTYSITVKSLVEINYKWRGVKQTPEIVSYKFLLEPKTNEFLEKAIVDYNNLDSIFNSRIQEAKEACLKLDELDKKIIKFNNKVTSSYKQFKEDYLKTLFI